VRTALDTNVISAIWSKEETVPVLLSKLERASLEGGLVVCVPVWAELYAYPGITADGIESFLQSTGIDVEFEIHPAVWKESALRYKSYSERRRRAGGNSPRRLLTDFVIGAHALLQADRLLTLDNGVYERNFPELLLL
jgi:hypothetical protein